MVFAEITQFRESPRGLEEWIAQIESRWRNIPEFEVDTERLKHLAVICDGNRRAAAERGLNPYFGHRVGIEVIRGIARACRQWEIKTLTFWTWSTENWEREEGQVKFIMGLAEKFLPDRELLREFQENEVRFTHLGRKDRLPGSVKATLESLERQTAQFNRYCLNLAMDYGGRDELVRAFRDIAQGIKEGVLQPDDIDENLISLHLDTAGQVLPDLVIRTGAKKGEFPHTSGFMLLQTIYAGWEFLPVLFPDLTPQSLLEPIQNFINYERRLGK